MPCCGLNNKAQSFVGLPEYLRLKLEFLAREQKH